MTRHTYTSLLAALLLLLALAACATAPALGPPAMPDALPGAAPTLERPEGAPEGPLTLEGPDGYLYLSGLSDPRPGELYVLQHGGPWDDGLGPRPQLGAARVARVFTTPQGPLALAQPEYLQPSATLQGTLPRRWEDAAPPRVAKGLASVTQLDGKTLHLDRGFFEGVQIGDRYLLLDPAQAPGERLGDRLYGVALVTHIEEHTSRAELLLQGGVRGSVKVGSWALFANPGAQDRPLAGTVEVARVLGGARADQDTLLAALQSYLDRSPSWRVSARALNQELDPLDPDLGRALTRQPYVHEPRLLLAASVQERGGKRHLILNYAATGLSVAHGMVAAAPEVGFDAGPLAELTPEALAPTFHALLTAMLVHRGQNAEALYLAESLLRTGGWDGPPRWHLRDQLAMRWVQAGHLREGLRLVEEDIALARQRDDQLALVNAVGTLYALYEDLGLSRQSADAARSFYEARKKIGDGPWTTHAWRAWIETLYKNGDLDEARAQHDAMQEACAPPLQRAEEARRQGAEPALADTSCAADLHGLALSAYWSLPPDQTLLRAQALDRALALAYLIGPFPLASVRLIQAMQSLRSDDFTGSTIAFLEAQRLFEKEGYTPGRARVDALQVNLFIAQDQRQKAFEVGMDSADLFAAAHDIQELTALYRNIARLYLNVTPNDLSVAAYVRAAAPVLAEALKLQLATGDLGAAAEVLYISGRFRLGSNPEEADKLLERAGELALLTGRFDVPALSALTRAFIARARGSLPEFKGHLELARRFAQLSGDPNLLQTVIQAERGDAPERDTL